MITYNDIYEATRSERYAEQLQPLQKNFITEVSQYLKDKKQVTIKETDEFSEVVLKTKKQIENAITFFRELIVRRRKKILSLVLIANETGISKQDFDNMLVFEKELFEDLMKCLDSSNKKLNGVLDDKKLVDSPTNEMIVFKEKVSKFVGPDEKEVGPFEEGDIANLPKKIVEILVSDGKAEKIME